MNRIGYPCIWMVGLVGGGVTRVTIESEVRLIYFGTNQKCRRMVCVCRLH